MRDRTSGRSPALGGPPRLDPGSGAGPGEDAADVRPRVVVDGERDVRDARDLERLPLPPRAVDRVAADAYPVRAPKHYLRLVDWSDPSDPIRRQIVPSADELAWDAREREDPIGDDAHSPVPRLTHRYPDRALLYATYRCAVYCRHCFRKESLDDDDAFREAEFEPAFEYLGRSDGIREVILTGGDPFVLSNARLAWLRGRLEAIPHLRLLRVHTRVPVVLPTRVTAELAGALRGRLMVAVVTHFNHPSEITTEAIHAARILRESGFMLLNQTVLLRGVNDDAATLETLFRELVYALGAKPYYLHHCDLTRGLTHFRTTIDDGLELMRHLRGRTSGLCVPQYVLDLPGGAGKTPLGPSYVRGRDMGRWQIESYDGVIHDYEECTAPNGPPRNDGPDDRSAPPER